MREFASGCFSFYVIRSPPRLVNARPKSREREREIRLLNMTIMTLDVVRFFFFSETGFSEMALKIEKDYADVATERNLFVPYIIRCYV